jgi:hypothetical protein
MPNHEARLLHSMVMLSTLRTAAGVRQSIDERRAGRDPSAQEAAHTARSYLRQAVADLAPLLVRLRMSLAIGPSDDSQAALVQDFEDRMALAVLARDLHVVHQRLLSLYPEVPEELVEDARLAQSAASRLIDAEDDRFRSGLRSFVESGFSVLAEMHRQTN